MSNLLDDNTFRRFMLAAAISTTAGCGGSRFYQTNVFHGMAENTAVEQKQDPLWQQAHLQVLQEPKPQPVKNRSYESWVCYEGDTSRKVIAFTFDDGPHPGKVQKLLAELKSLNVPATFFVVGKMVEKHPELIKMEVDAGHEVEDHSFSHVNLSKVSEEDAETEYRACKNLIVKATGEQPQFCRPPGGKATPEVVQAGIRCGMRTAMWSDDPKDYTNPGTHMISQNLMDHMSGGGIILLHEGVTQTMQVLPSVVKLLREKGYRFVTLSELMGKPKPIPNLVATTAH